MTPDPCRLLQHIGLLVTSMLNTLLSAACCVGLLLAISVTVAGQGQGLLKGCNTSDSNVPINARAPLYVDCPFDTTRIYVSLCVSLSLSHTHTTHTTQPCTTL